MTFERSAICPCWDLILTCTCTSPLVKVAALYAPVQDRSNGTKGEPQHGFRVAPEVQQYTGITISGIRWTIDRPRMLLSMATPEQNVPLWAYTVEGRSDGTRGEPQPEVARQRNHTGRHSIHDRVAHVVDCTFDPLWTVD